MLEHLQVVIVVRPFLRMIALIHHVRVIDTISSQHSYLIQLLLLLNHFLGSFSVTKQILDLVPLVLLKLGKLVLLRLDEDFLEDEFVLGLALSRERTIRCCDLL